MMTKKSGAAFAGALALTAFAPALVQAQAAGQPAAPLTGPAVPGMCVLSLEAVVGTSTVGKYVATRLQQLNQTASAEISADATSLQNDEKALEAGRASLSSEQLQQRAAALQGRETDLNRTVQIRREEMSQTEQNAQARILKESSPIFQEAARAHNCSIVLGGTGVLAAEPAMDLTPTVIAGLNAKITQFEFDRVHLDQTAAAPSGH
ncbi:MAG TPA: OmpH family outer membrane protein [Caulobacteraceae bacterium]|nr:OmpH family outer membrane protein [Caulobacteraceae bacterium]